MYCALVLKNNKGPRLVEICSLSEIHSLFNQVENETRNNMNSSNVKYVHLSENGSICKHYTADGLIYSGSELYELIWEPLESEIKNAKRIWFSPAGELYQIAIEYAETGTGAFNERKEVHRVSSTRQLLQSNLTHINKAVLFGGLDYDCLIEDSKAASPKGHMNKDVSGVVEAFKTRGGERFPYLRSTEDEIIYISTCLNTKGISTDLYVGDTGTEDTFKKVEKNNYKVIHLATHGFFWNERQVDYYGARLGWQSLQQNNGASQLEDVSMSRSGLVFSGVNSTISDDVNYVEPENDGILTAREISQLHLYGVDLVTLSACQTGLGEVTGDGVMGLQRGFKKAGVQSIIMSLWEVDDSATQILMTSFYKHLMQGKNKHIALRLAQHELKKIPEYNCPYYWASFILLD
jgi:CHAT domain-containing protein